MSGNPRNNSSAFFGPTSATIPSTDTPELMARRRRSAATALGKASCVGFFKQGLPLQVRRLDEIAVHDPQPADARAHQQIRQRRAQRAAAYNHGRGFEQALLARLADFAEKDLPGIAFVRFRIHKICRPAAP